MIMIYFFWKRIEKYEIKHVQKKTHQHGESIGKADKRFGWAAVTRILNIQIFKYKFIYRKISISVALFTKNLTIDFNRKWKRKFLFIFTKYLMRFLREKFVVTLRQHIPSRMHFKTVKTISSYLWCKIYKKNSVLSHIKVSFCIIKQLLSKKYGSLQHFEVGRGWSLGGGWVVRWSGIELCNKDLVLTVNCYVHFLIL